MLAIQSGQARPHRRARTGIIAITFKPLHRHFVAEVQGFDTREPIAIRQRDREETAEAA